MKHIDISERVMHNVTGFEKNRSKKMIVRIAGILTVLCCVLFFSSIFIFLRLQEQDTFSMFSLFTQDSEVIQLYWQDTVNTILQEIPLLQSSLSILIFVTMLIVIVVYGKKVIISFRRLRSITHMKKSNSSTLPLAIGIGILIALFLCVGIFLTRKKTETTYVPGTSDQAQITPSDINQNATVSANSPDVSMQPVTQGLTLTVSSPQNGSILTSDKVLVKGSTTPKSEVFVNDKELVADAKGAFSTTLTIDEGENVISVAANDADGNYAAQDITVTYQPAQ